MLGIDVSAAEILSQEDSHGGFHGDGITWIRFACEGTDIARQIAEKENWTPFPLNDTVKALVYGIEEGTAQIGPYLLDEDGGLLIPEIENGYYLLIDRQAEEGKAQADPEIDALVAARTAAKKEKNFAEADRIRDELKARGIEIIDTPQGTKWRKV